jgi:hypothetical protein
MAIAVHQESAVFAEGGDRVRPKYGRFSLEFELSDDLGKTHAMLALRTPQLIVLQF